MMAITTSAPRNFPLAAPSPWTAWMLLVLWVVLLLAAFLGGPHQQAPHNPVPWWVVMLFGTALVPAALWSMLLHREIRIDGGTLVVAAALVFARKVRVGDLALDKARVIDLGDQTEFKPLLRLWGFSLPGFNAGHFVLRNRSRAFCLLTQREHVLLLPLRDGKSVLLSPEKPQALLDALKAARG